MERMIKLIVKGSLNASKSGSWERNWWDTFLTRPQDCQLTSVISSVSRALEAILGTAGLSDTPIIVEYNKK